MGRGALHCLLTVALTVCSCVCAQASGEAICGSPAANDSALSVRFFNTTDEFFATGGSYTLGSWLTGNDNGLSVIASAPTTVTITNTLNIFSTYCGRVWVIFGK